MKQLKEIAIFFSVLAFITSLLTTILCFAMAGRGDTAFWGKIAAHSIPILLVSLIVFFIAFWDDFCKENEEWKS